jgi:diadenosine tetraphosphate (Ap4A) HIT family hydrolase
MTDSCPRCDIVAGRLIPAGGVIHDDGLWRVVHHPGATSDPGELLIVLRRHEEAIAALTDPETESLGPILRAGTRAIERVVRPERVYVASFNERIRHVHFFLLPRTRAMPSGHVTSDLFRRARGVLRGFKIARNPTDEARARAAERIRDEDVWPPLRA